MNIKKRICVIGHFGFKKESFDGQTIKTKTITRELEKKFGQEEVYKIDTGDGILSYTKLLYKTIYALATCRNIIIFPASRGIRIIAPELSIFNNIWHRSLQYCVIGGWLSELLKNKKTLSNHLKKFDAIYVETSTMKVALEQQGFSNIVIMPNCKNLKILKEDELVYSTREPYKLCTFSRVNKQKGIEDIVKAVTKINETNNRIIYSLDIYGEIDEKQIDWFNKLKNNFPKYIEYKGIISPNNSVNIIKDYFVLVFPTKYYTEGVPGTILDAYASGVPVVSSKWQSFSDVIDDDTTGIGYEFGNIEHLTKTLEIIMNKEKNINKMKKNCLLKANNYLPKNVIIKLINNL